MGLELHAFLLGAAGGRRAWLAPAWLLGAAAWGCIEAPEAPTDLDAAPGDRADAFVGDDAMPLGPLGDGVATLAGTSQAGFVDGPRAQTRFANPVNVLVAPEGLVYVADYDNHAVRVIHPGGEAETLVKQDGFQRPFGLALHDDVLFVQTDRNDELEQDAQSGTIWSVSTRGGRAQLVARDLGRPRGLAALADGRLVLVDSHHHTVRLLVPGEDTPTLLAGKLDQPGYQDGPGGQARFASPAGVAVDADGALLVADRMNHRIRRVGLDGQVSTLAGSGERGWLDGEGVSAQFDEPQAIVVDVTGQVFVAEAGNFCLRRIDNDGRVERLAGDRTPGFADGERLAARFYGLEGLAISADGTYLFVADGSRGEDLPYHRIRRVSLDEGATP